MAAFMTACLLTTAFFAAVETIPVKVQAATLYVGGTGPGNYSGIQSAVDAANAGDTIRVNSGLYRESIYVNKRVWLIGQGRDSTTVEGTGSGSVVTIVSDRVIMENFHVSESGPGASTDNDSAIEVIQSDYVRISNNSVTHIRIGILVQEGAGTFISNNSVSTIDRYGIAARFSVGTSIVGNSISSNRSSGIYLLGSTSSYISDNAVTGCLNGIEFRESDGNNASGNEVFSNRNRGIVVDHSEDAMVTENSVFRNYYGVSLTSSRDSAISDNNIFSNEHGIELTSSSNNIVEDNSIYRNNWTGLSFQNAGVNTIRNNSFYEDGIGVAGPGWIPDPSFDNLFYHNAFVSNGIHAGDGSEDDWDNGYPSGGNYWGNYTGADLFSGPNQDQAGGDGIGDTPYILHGACRDRYPLMSPTMATLFPPSEPTNLGASGAYGKVVLAWNPPASDGGSAIKGYRIYRNESGDSYALLAEVGTTPTHTDTGVFINVTYSYKVTAVNEIGEGMSSDEVSVSVHAGGDGSPSWDLLSVFKEPWFWAATILIIGLLAILLGVSRRRGRNRGASTKGLPAGPGDGGGGAGLGEDGQ